MASAMRFLVPRGSQAGVTLSRMFAALLLAASVAESTDALPRDPQALASEIVVTDDAVSVRVGGIERVRYQVALKQPPPGVEKPVAGSGFLHPVRTPGGAIVTTDFPTDYPHQHGLFHAWTKTEFRGHEVDFWNSHRGLGRVEHDATQPVEVIDSRTFRVHLNHVDRTGERPVVAMRERRTYRVECDDRETRIDVRSVLAAATDDPITLKRHVYGGVAARGPDHWTIAGGHRFVTPQGDDRDSLNHRPFDWVASTGPAAAGDTRFATLAMLSPRSNLRSPQPVRLHPTMPYFVFSPTVDEPYAITPGRPLASRYVYVASDGLPDTARLTELWRTVDGNAGDASP